MSAATDLHRCAAALAACDVDRATEDNGIGFSANDTGFGHRLANSDPASWGEQLTADAWHTLRRYKRQLLTLGLDFDLIPEPALPRSDDRRSGQRLVTADHNGYVLTFPYSPEIVAAVKEVPGRRWNPEQKVWSAPLSSGAAIRALCATHGFTASEAAQTAMTAENPPEAHTARVTGTVKIRGPKFHLSFAYDPAAVAAIKEIPGRRWNPDDRVWIVPITSVRQMMAFCEEYGIDMSALADVPDADPVIEPDISIDQHGFIIRFPFDRDLVTQVRDLPTATYDKLIGAWRVSRSASIDLAGFAESTNAVVDKDVERILEEANAQLERISKSRATDADLNIPTLRGTLLPFQRAGVVYTLEALGYEPQPDGTWSKKMLDRTSSTPIGSRG